MEHQLGRCKLKSLLNSSCSGPIQVHTNNLTSVQHDPEAQGGAVAYHLHVILGQGQAGLLMVFA